MPTDLILSYANRIGAALLIIIIGRVAAILISRTILKLIIRQQGDHEYSYKAGQSISQIIHLVMMVFVLLFAIQSAGLNVALLIGGLTFAIGYAMQETLGNLMAGLLLLTNPKYKLGLLMEFLGDIQLFGSLENITLRYSVIRGFDKQATLIPNMKLISTPMKTFKMENIVRYKLTINVSRKASIVQMQELIRGIVNQHEYVIQHDHTTVFLEEFTAQGTQLAIYFFFDPQCGYSSLKTRSEIQESIHQTLKEKNITIPYPRLLLETSKLT